MSAKYGKSAEPWTDPDDAPEIDAKWVKEAYIYEGDKLVKRGRGRPPLPDSAKKVPVKVRYDQDIIEAFRSTGPGWQTRMNQALRQFLSEHNVRELNGR